MNWTSLSSRAAAGLVAGIAGFASYNHIVKVARDAGEVGEVALVLPLSIDGLIVVGTMAMIDDKRAGREPRLSARVALGFGVVATLAANIASARDTLTARLVAAVPAVAFLIAVEVLARTGRKVTVAPEPAAVEEFVAPAVEPADEDRPAPDPWLYAVPLPTREPVDEPVEPAVEPVAQGPAQEAPGRVITPSMTAADRVVAAHLQKPTATHAQIAELAGVSVATVKRHRPSGSSTGAPPADLRLNGHDRSDLVRAGGETR